MENPETAATGQVDVWVTRLDATAQTLATMREVLCAEERARADRFHFARDMRRFVVARATLRDLLGQYLGREPQSVELVYGQYGKPAVAVGLLSTPLYFNVSHSDDIAAIAVSRTHELGIDVERINAEFPVDEVAARICCAAESRSLLDLAPTARHDRFFALWTRKEAYGKARGWGLALDPARIDASQGHHGADTRFAVRVDGALDTSVALSDLSVAPGYASALAVIGGNGEIVVRSLPQP